MDGKVCVTCHVWLPMTAYNERARAKDGHQARCRACSRAWYEENKVEHRKNVRRRNDRVRRELQEVVRRHLLAHPCVVCGETDLRVLEFDHRDPAAKRASVGVLQGGSFSLARLLEEIDRCDVKCANCHRIRTMGDCDSWRVVAERERRAAEAAVLDDLWQQVWEGVVD